MNNPPPKSSVFIKTFGCQMNEYDTQKLFKILEPTHTPVSTPEEADLILVNTCSVRDKPEQKLYSLLGEMKDLKKSNPEAMIGVGGCVAQQEGTNIVKRSKVVDFVFGTHNLSLVPSLVQLRKNGSSPQVAIDYRDEWEELPLGFAEFDPVQIGQRGNVTSLVSISRGCNKNCTYCIVPTTRGPEVSRAVDEILREVKIAVHRGSREIVLLGQTVNSYGIDLSPRVRFAELLNRISDIPGVERIRFTSPHPQEVKSDFIDLVAGNPKICRHIHMPLQAGSNRILKLMNRNYKRERYLEIIQELKSRVPDMTITTDVIVGFPGETEAEFEESLDILEKVRFFNTYSFVFSPRPGTKAAEMREEIPPEEKLSRLYRYQERQLRINEEYLETCIGKEAEVLLDGQNQAVQGALQGRTSQNVVVNLSKPTPDKRPGDLINVKISSARRFTLIADPV